MSLTVFGLFFSGFISTEPISKLTHGLEFVMKLCTGAQKGCLS